MFWRFGGYSNISTIDTLLDKQTTTLEDLLEEQDLIQELKSHHTKLIEFLRDDNNLHALLKYVVAPGPETEEDEEELEDEEQTVDDEQDKAEKKRLKYAFVACEILSCETWSIIEAIMSNQQYLTEFWDFLRRPAPLDPLQAGYFTKVNETLLDKKTEEMLDFFKSLPDIVPAILKHVDCPMVMDLLLKIISLDKAEGGAGIIDWICDQDLIPTLLSSLSPECNSSIQTSAGDFLKAIITVSANAAQNEQSCIGPNSLTRQLVSEPCIQQLISYMLKGGNPLTVGVGIVIEVIRKNNSDYDPENGQNPDAPPSSRDPIYLGTLLRLFAKHVPDFMELILSTKHTVTDGEKTKMVDRGVLKSTWGTNIEPLGFDRFKTCELMAELLHCSNMALLNEKGSEEFIKAKDAERERLRLSGMFTAPKEVDDSTIDVSGTSSKFENSFVPSASASTEEIKGGSGTDEEGFEDVEAPIPAEANRNTESESESEDLEEALIPSDSEKSDVASGASPAAGLDDVVRRISIEDTEMTSPPQDLDPTFSPTSDSKPGQLSPHPDDKPAPLFARSGDPNKTPTPASPKSPRNSDFPSAISSSIDATQWSSDAEIGDSPVPDQPVVGDYLKIMFVENKVVPTILSFFFRFPWNNFLHNVVYDVVQQVFNGPMDRGHNKFLAFDLFETGRITEQVINGQKRSEEAEESQNMRLGYMGHLTLVAEEVVKFGERHPKEILSPLVQDFIYGKPWEEYVTKTLAETRDRDNAILGGFRPDNGLGPRQAVLNAVNAGTSFAGSNVLAQAGLTGGQQGLDSIDLSNNGSATSAGYNSGGSLLSGFGSSSDDEDEEMEDDHEDESKRAMVQLSAADTGLPADSDQPVPLIPPPPAPLNIEPSRARRRLAKRLAHRQQQQEQEAEAAASEFGMEDDPFAALGDNDDQDGEDSFSLDEEEQDITSFGKRGNSGAFGNNSEGSTHYSISRGINNLFSSSQDRRTAQDSFEGSLDSSSSGSGSDGDPDQTPAEARTSLERRPLDIDDEDDEDEDEEMGEMVAPTEEVNSSDEEMLSPKERERLGLSNRQSDDDESSEFDGQGDEDQEDDVVEIPPMSKHKRRSRGSVG